MKETTPLMIYLAGPIDGITFEEANEWREELAHEYPNVLFFMPQLAYANANRTNARLVHHMNQHAIACAHAVLANASGPGVGFGTIREIDFAKMQNRFVVVVDADHRLEHTLMTYDLEVAGDFHGAMAKILEWHAEQANRPETFMGIPITQFKEIEPDEQDE